MWLPLSAVAIYRVVTQIGTVFVLVVTAFEVPVSTAISATHLSGDIQRLRHIIRSTRLLMVAVTAIPVAGVFVFAGPILEMFFGLGNEVAIRSDEHTSELQSLMRISYAVFCLKNKNYHIPLYHTHYHNQSLH